MRLLLNRSNAVIRVARPTDAERLTAIALASKAHWGYSADFMAACRAELTVTANDVHRLTISVLETDRPVGFSAIEWLGGGRAELDALFVEPEHIGLGYGRLLMNHAAATAKARKVHTLIIQADPNAAAFYEAVGARRTGERPSASIPGRLLPLFELNVEEVTAGRV